MVNIDLAGGALLDLGIYSLTWLFQTLYHVQEPPKESPQVISAVAKYDRTGADEMTTIVLHFPRHKPFSGSYVYCGVQSGDVGALTSFT